MPRPLYSLQVNLNEQVIHLLDEMVKVGIYGLNRADVARRLICEGIERKLSIERKVDLRKPDGNKRRRS